MDRSQFDGLCSELERIENRPVYYGVDYAIRRGSWVASWIDEGWDGLDQPGVHLRAASGEPSLTLGGDHNRVYVTKPDVDTLRPLLAESHRLASMRNGGHLSKRPYAEIFGPLAKALKAATHPPPGEELHAGGPKARIPGGEPKCGVAISLCAYEAVKHTSTDADQLWVDRILDRLSNVRLGWDEEMSGLQDAIDDQPSPALQALAGAYGCSNDILATDAGPGLVAAVQWLDAHRPEETFPLLLELDRIVLVCELDAVLLKRKKTPVEAERVLWRAADAKNMPAFWIARRGDVHFFFGKLGRRWVLESGDRDSVLASVPDALLASAVGRVLASCGG